MTARVVLAPAAQTQVSDAINAWRESHPASPFLLEDEFADVLYMIEDHPRIGKLFPLREAPNARRFLLRESLYHVYYVYEPNQKTVFVRALWGARRGGPPTIG